MNSEVILIKKVLSTLKCLEDRLIALDEKVESIKNKP